ncbi:SRPBCC family protein [Pseudohoeflea coraliihabitans]|uniref:SRPBCC family protein n=1 Tax=Pseudohoeflea coraliihabitans TaxID=2860393 RepID=A0ABS6WNK2_9HYPH|nr:SRPBCC family protein [Pseudohoeflea sp. DP4N28-3]MBW3097537.1 SRPBCC family protein [Pseudohoeflea sp. DP4N28-3]
MTRVVETAIVNVPIDTLWHWLRDFNSHVEWHPAIATSAIEDDAPSDEVGAVRSFSLQDGGRLREQLLQLDDQARELTYCLLDSPLPLYNYVATIRLRPVTDPAHQGGATFWEWRSTFDPPPERRAELSALVAKDIYRAGMRGLETHIRKGAGAAGATLRVARAQGVSQSDRLDTRPDSATPPRTAAAIAAPASAPGSTAGLAPGPAMGSAILIDRHGGPEVLVQRHVSVAPPGPGEVRIRQTYAGVNFIDIYCRTGYFDLVAPPGIPGMEAVGIVESVGPAVSHLAVGDRVGYACAPPGAYVSLRTMDAALVARLPDALPDERAAAGLLKGMTAGFLLHDVHPVRPGEIVVVHAAAGGAGSLLTQWASALGALVIGTVSTRDKAQAAYANGAREVLIGRGHEFLDGVRDLTDGRGADVIYDAIGRDSFSASLDALAIRGHLVSYGQASGDIGPREIGPLASKSITLSRPNYGHYVFDRTTMQRQSGRLFEALAQGHLTIDAPAVFPLEEAGNAHAAIESGRTQGASVLRL